MSRYILSIDQSTSASKAFLVDERGLIVKKASIAHQQYYPAPGFVEHDAVEIWANVVEVLAEVSQGIAQKDIAALSISNQRETTVLWDRATGEPVCRALVWQDTRAQVLCREMDIISQEIWRRTGLGLSPYYPAAKAAWVLNSDPKLMARAEAGEICIGTVDSYLIYRLSGNRVYATDVSNAGRTQLLNLKKLAWDEQVCAWFHIPMCCLPNILPSDAVFAETVCQGLPQGVPVCGVMGDSHASLFGQGCAAPGMAKATYGTGSSVMMHTGGDPVLSSHGLSSCVGYGFQGKTCYVLEGNITCSGDTLVWLSKELGMLSDPEEAEEIAKTVADTQGVYLVPAFMGLGAPYFDSEARAVICGMSRGTTCAHVVRAALESIAYQECGVLSAMQKDSGFAVSILRADGGASRNSLLMQFQADLCNCTIACAAQSELSALGASYMGGISAGLYKGIEEIPACSVQGAQYAPAMEESKRRQLLAGWADALERARSRNNLV
jgi:glycerol kinase